MKKSILLFFFSLCLGAVSSFGAVTVQIIANASTGQVQDSTGTALPDGSLMRVGFFDVTGLQNLTPSQLLDASLVEPLFTEFKTFTSASGDFLQFDNTLDATNVGDQVYLWVFNSSLAATATEYGIFSSSTWNSPADTGSLNMVSSAINETIAGSTDGSSPTNYLLTPVPEPAHYAALLGLVGLAVAMWRRRR